MMKHKLVLLEFATWSFRINAKEKNRYFKGHQQFKQSETVRSLQVYPAYESASMLRYNHAVDSISIYTHTIDFINNLANTVISFNREYM